VTDGVDTSMHSVQTPGEHTGSHRIVAHTDTAHLGDGDHSMLPLGCASDPHIGWGDFSVHFTDKSSHPTLLPS
jgi:hypothetical protein